MDNEAICIRTRPSPQPTSYTTSLASSSAYRNAISMAEDGVLHNFFRGASISSCFLLISASLQIATSGDTYCRDERR